LQQLDTCSRKFTHTIPEKNTYPSIHNNLHATSLGSNALRGQFSIDKRSESVQYSTK